VLLQVGGDLAGVVDAVVVADHRDHRGARERPEHLAYQRGEVSGAAASQPVHPAPGAHLDRAEHGDLPVRARVEICGRAVRSVQLARTCGSGFRWVSSSASTTARRAVLSAGPRSGPRRGHGPVAAGGDPPGQPPTAQPGLWAPELSPVLTLASGRKDANASHRCSSQARQTSGTPRASAHAARVRFIPFLFRRQHRLRAQHALRAR